MTKINKKALNLIRKLEIHSPYPLFYQFEMTKGEQKVFDSYIRNSKHYLEFGAGGSTLRVLQKSKAIIYSTESSLDYIKFLSKHFIIRKAQNKRLFFHHADIGQTQRWGYPLSKDSEKLFPNYSNSIFETLVSSSIDTVLIDGRFRVACILNVLLNMSSNENITILVHDFWHRAKYHSVLKYLTEVQRTDSLGVFKIKKEVNLISVKQDYDNYKYIID